MTIHTLAADICDRIPEMARDSKTNNQKVIETMIREFLDSTRCSPPLVYIAEDKLPTIDQIHQMFALENPPTAEAWDKKNT
jgi:hypothetical protein